MSPDGDIIFATGNAHIRLNQKPAFSESLLNPPNGLHGAGIVFSVDDLAVTDAVLAANVVSSAEAGGRLVVSAAPGQGVAFAFEEK